MFTTVNLFILITNALSETISVKYIEAISVDLFVCCLQLEISSNIDSRKTNKSKLRNTYNTTTARLSFRQDQFPFICFLHAQKSKYLYNLSFSVYLNQTQSRDKVSKAKILGNQELYVKSGSDINLTCIASQISNPPSFIYWYKGGRVVNYSQRGGINVQTDRNTKTSKLIIARATTGDSGNYTCAPSNSGKCLSKRDIKSND